MVKGRTEIDRSLTLDKDAIYFRKHGHTLILESNTNGSLKAAYVCDINGELCAMFNSLDLAVDYLLCLVSPLRNLYST